MGSPLGPLLANVFMCSTEDKLDQYGKLLWHLYHHSDIASARIFLDTLNHCYPSAKFTMEVEQNALLPFIGVEVSTTSVFNIYLYHKKIKDKVIHFKVIHFKVIHFKSVKLSYQNQDQGLRKTNQHRPFTPLPEPCGHSVQAQSDMLTAYCPTSHTSHKNVIDLRMYSLSLSTWSTYSIWLSSNS